MRCVDLTQNMWTFQLYLKSLGKDCWYGKMSKMSAHPLLSSKSALTWSMIWPQTSPYHQLSALSCLQTRPWLLIMPWLAGADILGKTNEICSEPPSGFGSDSALKVNSCVHTVNIHFQENWRWKKQPERGKPQSIENQCSGAHEDTAEAILFLTTGSRLSFPHVAAIRS